MGWNVLSSVSAWPRVSGVPTHGLAPTLASGVTHSPIRPPWLGRVCLPAAGWAGQRPAELGEDAGRLGVQPVVLQSSDLLAGSVGAACQSLQNAQVSRAPGLSGRPGCRAVGRRSQPGPRGWGTWWLCPPASHLWMRAWLCDPPTSSGPCVGPPKPPNCSKWLQLLLGRQ